MALHNSLKERGLGSVQDRLRVGLVGAGKFGVRRAVGMAKNAKTNIRVVVDQIPENARSLAETLGCAQSTDWREVIARKDIDAVVVSTSTQFLSEISRAALLEGKHVLCEKPFARNVQEARESVNEAAKRDLCLKVGYNHRYHPAIFKAHTLFAEGAIGKIQFIRCVYGHGGRAGYEREWRADPALSGGGQLLDQGVHVIDLFQWFLADFEEVKAFTTTSYWPMAPAEDNVFALLRTSEGCVATMHASWTNWKNVFTFEIYGERGFLSATGLGGHYGQERLCWGDRHALGTKPEEHWYDFTGPDNSLEEEWNVFVECVFAGQQPPSSGKDSLKTLELVKAIYQSAAANQGVAVHPVMDDRFS
jgi:predicted dehydrogenase